MLGILCNEGLFIEIKKSYKQSCAIGKKKIKTCTPPRNWTVFTASDPSEETDQDWHEADGQDVEIRKQEKIKQNQDKKIFIIKGLLPAEQLLTQIKTPFTPKNT